MWTYNYSDELYHHGIKGQKWEVRRFQNKDGSLTNAGRSRYDESKNTILQKHRNNLINKYMGRGYSREAAETAAKQRMRTELVVGAIGTVAVVTLGSKAVTKIGQEYCDKTLKSGKIIQNIGPRSDTSFKDTPFFAAINQHDKTAYGMLYPQEKKRMVEAAGDKYNGIFKNQIKMNTDIKRASNRNARRIFYDKMNSDPEFNKKVLDTMWSTNYYKGVREYKKTGKLSKRLYDSFNQSLATPEMQKTGLHNQFYSDLKKKGYNAIVDINDTKYSGYKKIVKSPTIFFGNDKWDKISSQKISEIDIDKNADKYITGYLNKEIAKYIGSRGGAIVGIKTISDSVKVKKYLDEHPNSKLSRKEILEIMKDR